MAQAAQGGSRPNNLPMDRHVLNQFAGLLLAQAGLHFTSHNIGDLEAGIRATMTDLGFNSPSRLLARLGQPGEEAKISFEALIRSVTIGETYFMRYPEQFAVLREDILPELIKKRRKSNDLFMRLWSAGCSSGEEAYSLAMTLRELIPDWSAWNITIHATDINRDSLARGEAAEFGAWSFRGVPDELRAKHFHPKGDGKIFTVDDALRRVVNFDYLNLGDDCYPSLLTQTTAMDFIFCRNVLIYFSEASAQHVIDRLFQSLIDGGSLMVGPVEPNTEMFRRYRSRFHKGTMVYTRPEFDEIVAPVVPEITQPVRAPAPKAKNTLGGTTKLEFTPRNKAVPLAEDARSHLQMAQAAWRDGHLVRAKDFAARAVELDTSLGEGHFMLALVAADLGHFADAAGHCARAIERTPLDVRAHHLAAIIASEQGNKDDAVKHLKRCVFLDRNFVLAHFGLAVALKEMKQKADCARYLKNTLALLNEYPDDATLPGVEDIAAGWVKKVAKKYLRDLDDATDRGR